MTPSSAPGGTGTRRAQRTTEARLLVVDDEPNILELLAASLRFAGFEVTTAANGARGARRWPAASGRTWSCST